VGCSGNLPKKVQGKGGKARTGEAKRTYGKREGEGGDGAEISYQTTGQQGWVISHPRDRETRKVKWAERKRGKKKCTLNRGMQRRKKTLCCGPKKKGMGKRLDADKSKVSTEKTSMEFV